MVKFVKWTALLAMVWGGVWFLFGKSLGIEGVGGGWGSFFGGGFLLGGGFVVILLAAITSRPTSNASSGAPVVQTNGTSSVQDLPVILAIVTMVVFIALLVSQYYSKGGILQ